MLTVAVFTYQRPSTLISLLNSLDHPEIQQVLLFNDDEQRGLKTHDLAVTPYVKERLQIFNPQDFNFTGRQFRKPFYMNIAVEKSANEAILFTDDDGQFSEHAIRLHAQYIQEYSFCAGSILRKRFPPIISKSILQGTNYSIQKHFFQAIGGYDTEFHKSAGSGDPDFWFRVHKAVMSHPEFSAAWLKNARQNVIGKTSRQHKARDLDPNAYTNSKHNLSLKGPMYKWFPHIRDKTQWMNVIK